MVSTIGGASKSGTACVGLRQFGDSSWRIGAADGASWATVGSATAKRATTIRVTRFISSFSLFVVVVRGLNLEIRKHAGTRAMEEEAAEEGATSASRFEPRGRL